MGDPVLNTDFPSVASESPVVRMLILERQRLLNEIERIDRFLAQEGMTAPKITAEPDAQNDAQKGNILSKVQTMKKVLETASTPLTPGDLVDGMVRFGYSFSSRNPANTLNPYLYGQKRLPWIKKFGRGFILDSRQSEFEKMIHPDSPLPPPQTVP